MSLSYDTTQTVTGIQDACGRPSQNELVVLVNVSGTYKIRRLSTSAGHTQVGSDVTITGQTPTNIAMLTADKVAGVSHNDGNVFILDLISSTLYTANVGEAAYVANRAQVIACQSVCGVGYSIGTNFNAEPKFDAGTNSMTGINFGAANIFVETQTSTDLFTCIIPKDDTLGFLLGTVNGRIIEIDINGNIISNYAIPDIRIASPIASSNPVIRGPAQMAYFSGYLLVETITGEVFLIDHASRKVLQTFSLSSNYQVPYANPPLVLSTASNQTVLMAMAATTMSSSTAIAEFDMCLTPMKFQDIRWVGVNQAPIMDLGIVGSAVWATVPSQNKLIWFTISPTRSITIQTIDFTNAMPGEVLAIDDSVSPAEIMFHTTVPNSGTIKMPLTSGKNIILAAVQPDFSSGTRLTTQINRIST